MLKCLQRKISEEEITGYIRHVVNPQIFTLRTLLRDYRKASISDIKYLNERIIEIEARQKEIAEFLLDITAIIISQDKAHKATRKPKATKSKIVAKGRGGIRGKP